MWPLSSSMGGGGVGKALVAGPLKKILFLRLHQSRICFPYNSNIVYCINQYDAYQELFLVISVIYIPGES